MAKKFENLREGYVVKYMAQQLRARREALGISVADAARSVGYSSYQGWQCIESGKGFPVTSKLYGIAKMLKCQVGDLFPKTDV